MALLQGIQLTFCDGKYMAFCTVVSKVEGTYSQLALQIFQISSAIKTIPTFTKLDLHHIYKTKVSICRFYVRRMSGENNTSA